MILIVIVTNQTILDAKSSNYLNLSAKASAQSDQSLCLRELAIH